MANFASSNLVKAQAALKEDFTKPEMREKILPALRLGLSNRDILIPGANELRKREDRAVSGYYMKRQSRVPGSTRTATHTGVSGDSAELPFTWVTYTDVFSQSMKQLDTNVFSYTQAFKQGMMNCILNIHAQIETDSINNLLTNVTQVVKTSTPIGSRVPWTGATNYAYEIAASDQKQFFQLAKMVMVENYYNENTFDVLASSNTWVNASFNQSQGAGNAQNLAFQFTGMDIKPSVELADANYGQGIALVMQPKTYGLIDWIPKQNREGEGDYDSYLGGYGSMPDPTGTGLTFAVHMYALRSDTSGLNGVQQDDLLQVELSVDVAFCLTPLSTSGESTVYKFGQL